MAELREAVEELADARRAEAYAFALLAAVVLSLALLAVVALALL